MSFSFDQTRSFKKLDPATFQTPFLQLFFFMFADRISIPYLHTSPLNLSKERERERERERRERVDLYANSD
jgi:hypothetical protein